ncbi:MAG: hypothetical protein ABIN01_13990 [Ferruginibacter sp.]
MIATTINLRTRDSFQQQAQLDHSQIIIKAFIESCKTLDASILEPFMEEDNIFEDKSKYLFLAGLKTLFNRYKSIEHLCSEVYLHEGTCAGCRYGKAVNLFSVVLSGRNIFKDVFAYFIEEKNGILIDIYRCNLFCNK